MAVDHFDKGDLVCVEGTFTDPKNSDAAVDPTSVFFAFKDPSGNDTTYQYGVDAEVTKVSTGVYRCNVDADETGTFYYRWYSTGTGQASEPGHFVVKNIQV